MDLIDFNKDVFSVTDVGLVRQANEDNCYAIETPNGFLFVVCDGMGGHVGGAKASAIAVNSIVNYFTKEHYAIARQALEDALIFANKQILDVATANPELRGMGTTACVLLLRDDQAWIAHIGDSRIYLYCNKQQQLHRITKDHSVVQSLVDQGIISEAEAEHHPDKNRILKTLGIKKEIYPEICTMPVLPAKGDVFLICSDGLSGMVNDDVLQHILDQKVSLQEKGENMLAFAKQAGGTDNITVQLIQVSNSPHENSVFESKNSFSANTSKENKRNKKLNLKTIAIIALFVAAAIVVLVTFNPFHNETKNISQENKTVETPKVKTWEDQVREKGYSLNPIGITRKGEKVYGREIIDEREKEIECIIVHGGDYFIGKATVYSGGENYVVIRDKKGKNYDKYGNPK